MTDIPTREPYYADESVQLHCGDALEVLRILPDASVDCCVTSPPYYGLRDYGEPGQYGLENSPAEYVETLRAVFAEVRRVLVADGTLWLNLGDSYADDAKWGGSSGGKHVDALHGASGIGRGRRVTGLPPKSLIGVPWRVAFALQDDGWVLRSDVIWDKPNAMPEPVKDRPTVTHEHVFLLAKQPRYHFDLDAIREPLLYPDLADGSRVSGGKNKTNGGGVGSTSRRRGGNAWTPAYGTPTTAGDRHSATAAATSQLTESGIQAFVPTPTDLSSPSVPRGAIPPGANRPKGAGAEGRRHTAEHPKGRNPGDVWNIPTQPFPEAHFAVMAPELARRCVVAGCKPGGVVLDPFCGVGTTGMVAGQNGRRFIGIDLSAETLDLALTTRLAQGALIEDAS